MERTGSKFLFTLLAFFLFLAVFSRSKAENLFDWKFPALDKLVVNEFYLNDLGFIILGSHRIAADLGYIQFLQYYSTPPSKNSGESAVLNLARSPFSFKTFEGPFLDKKLSGPFPRLYEIFLRIMRLDPFFHPPILEGGSVLAFNHQRFGQALDLFKEALGWDPSFHRYRLYMTAILYRFQGRDDKLVDLLVLAIQFPDCPVLLKHILANLLVKYHRMEEAAAVLAHIAETAPQMRDKEDAFKRLRELVKKHPNLKAKLLSSVEATSRN